MELSGVNNRFLNTINDVSVAKSKSDNIAFKQMYDKIKGNNKKDIEEAGEKFESYFAYKILKQMYESIPRQNIMGGNNDSYYRDMLIDAYTKEIAQKGSFGIKDMIVKELSKEGNET